MIRSFPMFAVAFIGVSISLAGCGAREESGESASPLYGYPPEHEDAHAEAPDAHAGARADAHDEVDAGSTEETDAAADVAPSAPTFTDVYTTVISGTCTGCHGNSHGTGLAMATQALAYANLVDKKAGTGGAGACNDGIRTRVVPGDAAASLLFRKISHTQDCGRGMPANQPKLEQSKIELVQSWINAGARDD